MRATAEASTASPTGPIRRASPRSASGGINCQPDGTDPASIAALGEPRLGFLISAGNLDAMVNHYTVNTKPRHEDADTPGGRAGARPNRAVTVYGNLIRRTFKDKPIIIGGIEASLRRLAPASPTGPPRRASPRTASRAWAFPTRPATSTRW